MLFEKIAVLTEAYTVEKDLFVATDGAFISYVGKEKPQGDFGRCVPGKDRLLMPAFYNAHGHTPMALLRGYGENMALSAWLNEKIFPFEAKLKLDGEMVYNATLLGLVEMFAAGVVSSTDMYFCGDAIMAAFGEAGAKVNLSLGTMCFDERGFYELPDYAEHEALLKKYHGKEDGRLRLDMSLHAEYTSTPRVVGEVAAYAKEKNCHLHLHLAETENEQKECLARHGKTPAQYFYDLGCFDQPATAAHCVWLTAEDRAILAEKDVTVATCPVSNMKLASGIADIKAMEASGLRVALGTDGASSNNSLGMFDEMKTLCLAQRVAHGDPAALAPEAALAYATRNGALSQGRNDVGLIRKGFRADLVMLRTEHPHFYPRRQLVNHLVYAADGGDVAMTLCDGRVVYENGLFPTIDMEKVKAKAEADYDKIIMSL